MRALNDVPEPVEIVTLLTAENSVENRSQADGCAVLSALTPSQHRVLNAVESHVQVHGYPPSLRDLVDACGLSKSVVVEKLEALVRLGYVRRDAGVDRGIVVLVSAASARVIELKPLRKVEHLCDRCSRLVTEPAPVRPGPAKAKPRSAAERKVG